MQWGVGWGQRPNSEDRRQRPSPIRIIGGERDPQFGEGESWALSVPGSGRCLQRKGICRLSPSSRDDSNEQGQGPLSFILCTPSPWLWGWPREETLPTSRLCPPQGLSFHAPE